jgi:hypothetical protein
LAGFEVLGVNTFGGFDAEVEGAEGAEYLIY